MLEEDVSTSLRSMADPRPLTASQLDAVEARAATRRVRRRSMTVLAVLALLLVGLVAARFLSHWVDHVPPANGRTATVAIDGAGILVEIETVFPDDRQLLSGTLTLSGVSDATYFYPEDGTDNDVRPSPLPLPAGTHVLVGGSVLPDCADPGALPAVSVSSQASDGTLRTDDYQLSDPDTYLDLVTQWCHTPVRATVERYRVTTEHHVRVVLRITNPTEDTVVVESEGYRGTDSRWDAAEIDVPPASQRLLTITGAGSGDCRDVSTPWNSGHLTVDDAPLSLDLASCP